MRRMIEEKMIRNKETPHLIPPPILPPIDERGPPFDICGELQSYEIKRVNGDARQTIREERGYIWQTQPNSQ